MTQNLSNWTAQSISSPPCFWAELYCLRASFQGSKDRLVCEARVHRGILLLKWWLLPPLSSPAASMLPFTPHLAASCCFCWRGRENDRAPVWKNICTSCRVKFPVSLSLSVSSSQEGWGCQGREAGEKLSENKGKHMAVKPAVNDRKSQTAGTITGQKYIKHLNYSKSWQPGIKTTHLSLI